MIRKSLAGIRRVAFPPAVPTSQKQGVPAQIAAGFRAQPPKLRWLIIVLAIAALIILTWSCWDLFTHPRDGDWIVLAMLALLTVPFMIFLPSMEALIFIGDAYLMAIAIMHGTSACVAAASVNALGILNFTAKSGKRFISVFNISVLLCEGFLFSTAYRLAKPASAQGFAAMILPLAIMALVSFVFTSLLTATAVSWRRGNPVLGFWARMAFPLLPNSLIAAAIAGCIAVWYQGNPWIAPAFIPGIALIWGWTKAFANRQLMKAAAQP